MPVAMTASFEPEPERTDLTTQDLPTIHIVEDMNTWDADKVLRWIQLTNLNLLQGGDLYSFKRADFIGIVFLVSDAALFRSKGMCRECSLGLEVLVNEVKEGSKFIQWT